MPISRQQFTGVGLLLLLLIIVGLAIVFPPNEYVPAAKWGAALESAGVLGAALFFLASLLATSVGLPRQLVAFIGGLAYGLIGGLLLSLAAALCGCALTATVSRRYFATLIQTRFPRPIATLNRSLHLPPSGTCRHGGHQGPGMAYFFSIIRNRNRVIILPSLFCDKVIATTLPTHRTDLSPMSNFKKTSTLATATSLLMALALQPASALEGGWQIGVNAGVSRLSPDTDDSDFTLDEEQSTAASIYLGRDFTSTISAEIALSTLGEAGLSQDASIEYQAVSVGATAYVFGESETFNRADGLSGYLRLGLSAIQNESDIELDKSDNTSIWLGVGVQYPLSERWGLRAELTSYDGDAQALLAGVYWRTGGKAAARSTSISASAPTVQSAPTAQASAPAVIEPRSAPICPAASQILDANDCALLNGVVTGLDFEIRTAQLTSSGTASLDQIAATLNKYADVVVEVQVHTEDVGNAELESQLATRRVH